MKDSLGALVTALQQAVNQAGEQLRAQQLEILNRYFDEDNRPLYVKLRLPRLGMNGELEHAEVEVPRLSLVPMGTMCMDEVELDFSVRLCGLEKEGRVGGPRQILIESPGSFTAEKDRAHIRIKFKGGEPPEAVMKLNDTLLNIIP